MAGLVPGPALRAEPVPARGTAEAMTRAKLQADLGQYVEAAEGFRVLAEAEPDVPASVRAEAMVRLGMVRQAAGDSTGSVEAFAEALRRHGDDEEAVALLVHAVGGVVPSADHWKGRWRKLQLGIDVTDADRPQPWIHWPEAPWKPRRTMGDPDDRVVRFTRPRPLYEGAPISLHFQDGDLGDIFRLFADISGLNVVVYPGTKGLATLRFANIPWEDGLDRILSANGLGSRRNGPVLLIARVDLLGPEPAPFVGAPSDFDFREVDLKEAFRTIAGRGGQRVELDERVAGRLSLRLVGVPWDQAFDVVARVNGLGWTRRGDLIRVGVLEPGPAKR